MERYKFYHRVWLLSLIAIFLYCPSSEAIRVVPGKLDHFTLIVSDVVVAGKPFTVELEAKDKFDNTIINYDETGSNVEIKIIAKVLHHLFGFIQTQYSVIYKNAS